MVNCIHSKNNTCDISSKLANLDVPLDGKACTHCTADKKPCSENLVTIGRAMITLRKNNLPIPKELVAKITPKPLLSGPGTELKKLVSWFVWLRDVADCQSCYNREQQMNQWGPNECRKNITTIVEWLRESAAKHSIPFSETLVKIIINKAIRNSEKHYEVVRSSNNSST